MISIDLRTNLLEGKGVIVRENGTAQDRTGELFVCQSILNILYFKVKNCCTSHCIFLFKETRVQRSTIVTSLTKYCHLRSGSLPGVLCMKTSVQGKCCPGPCLVPHQWRLQSYVNVVTVLAWYPINKDFTVFKLPQGVIPHTPQTPCRHHVMSQKDLLWQCVSVR